MRFIVDANLPANVAEIISAHGHEAIHTSELLAGNATQDNDILVVA